MPVEARGEDKVRQLVLDAMFGFESWSDLQPLCQSG
jgi:hypothetical protein